MVGALVDGSVTSLLTEKRKTTRLQIWLALFGAVSLVSCVEPPARVSHPPRPSVDAPVVTWSKVPGLPPADSVSYTALDFLNEKLGWIGTSEGSVYRTVDGGVTWIGPAIGAGIPIRSLDFPTIDHGWFVSREGAIRSSVDGGRAWESQDSGVRTDLWAVSFCSEKHGLAVGAGGTVLFTKDGGGSWLKGKNDILKDLFAVELFDPDNGWAVGEDGALLVTSDGGKTWSPQDSGVDTNLTSVDFIDKDRGWISGEGGTVLSTKDGGEEWVRQTTGTEDRLWSTSFVDESVGLAVGYDLGGYDTVLATVDGGFTWSLQLDDGKTAALSSVQLTSASTAWGISTVGIVWQGRLSEQNPPFVSTFKVSASQREFEWIVERAVESRDIHCSIAVYGTGRSDGALATESVAAIHAEDDRLVFRWTWEPASGDFKIDSGDELFYQVGISDTGVDHPPKRMPGTYEYKSGFSLWFEGVGAFIGLVFGGFIAGVILVVLARSIARRLSRSVPPAALETAPSEIGREGSDFDELTGSQMGIFKEKLVVVFGNAKELDVFLQEHDFPPLNNSARDTKFPIQVFDLIHDLKRRGDFGKFVADVSRAYPNAPALKNLSESLGIGGNQAKGKRGEAGHG